MPDDNILEHSPGEPRLLRKPKPSIKIIIEGPAGSGKSTVLALIENLLLDHTNPRHSIISQSNRDFTERELDAATKALKTSSTSFSVVERQTP